VGDGRFVDRKRCVLIRLHEVVRRRRPKPQLRRCEPFSTSIARRIGDIAEAAGLRALFPVIRRAGAMGLLRSAGGTRSSGRVARLRMQSADADEASCRTCSRKRPEKLLN